MLGALPPTNMAPVGRYLEDEFPKRKGPDLSCHSEREGTYF